MRGRFCNYFYLFPEIPQKMRHRNSAASTRSYELNPINTNDCLKYFLKETLIFYFFLSSPDSDKNKYNAYYKECNLVWTSVIEFLFLIGPKVSSSIYLAHIFFTHMSQMFIRIPTFDWPKTITWCFGVMFYVSIKLNMRNFDWSLLQCTNDAEEY